MDNVQGVHGFFPETGGRPQRQNKKKYKTCPIPSGSDFETLTPSNFGKF